MKKIKLLLGMFCLLLAVSTTVLPTQVLADPDPPQQTNPGAQQPAEIPWWVWVIILRL